MKTKHAQYQQMVVSFLDLLGFKKMADGSLKPSQILWILDLLRQQAKASRDDAKLLKVTVINISDCTIRGIEVLHNAGQPTIQMELLRLVHIQSEMIVQDVLLRGGLSIGECYMRRGMVFGPAYQRAYQIESTEAKFPRIVIDDRVIERARKSPDVLGGETSRQLMLQLEELVACDPLDGKWFVDYLRAFKSELDIPSDYIVKFIPHHRDLIRKGMAQFKSSSAVLEKYKWMRDYHNRTVNKLPNQEIEHFGMKRTGLLV